LGDFFVLAAFSGVLAFVCYCGSLMTSGASAPVELTNALPETHHADSIRRADQLAESCLNGVMQNVLFNPGTGRPRTYQDAPSGRDTFWAIVRCEGDYKEALPAELHGSRWANNRWGLIKGYSLPKGWQ
jgi:hypothetical protein